MKNVSITDSAEASVLLESRKLRLVLLDACKQSEEWRRVLLWNGSAATNPLLTETKTFGRFLVEFNVARRVRKGHQDALRTGLAKLLPVALMDASGAALAALASHSDVQPHLRAVEVSLLSKVATYVSPGRFFPTDLRNRKGLRKLGYRAPSGSASYVAHLRWMNHAFDRHAAWLAAALHPFLPCDCSTEEREIILRRTVDVWLMMLGGQDRTV